MQTTRKRLAVLASVTIFFVILLVALAGRETPSKTVQIGFAGPSLVETNAVLFTMTNQNDFPISYQLSVQTASGFKLGRKGAAKTGDVFPNNTFTFFVSIPQAHRWRVGGTYWQTSTPKLGPMRSWIVATLQKLKLQRLSDWMARRPSTGSVIGPEMTNDRPS